MEENGALGRVSERPLDTKYCRIEGLIAIFDLNNPYVV